MSDTSFRQKPQAGRQGTVGSATEKAEAFGRDVKDQASSAAEQATQEVRSQVSGLADSAKELASNAGEKLRAGAEQQKNVGADYVTGVADAVRHAAEGFDEQMPQAAQYIRQAAQQIDTMSDALRRRDLSELFQNVQDFARQQPTAFLGATFLAGFAAVRFLKSSAPARSGGQYRPQGQRLQGSTEYGHYGQPHRGQQHTSPPLAPDYGDRRGL